MKWPEFLTKNSDFPLRRLSDNRDKSQLNMVLHSYNLSSIVKLMMM
jgi:hypothetical protein